MSATPQQARIQTSCLVILATMAVGFVLYWMQSVLIPLVLALFLMILLDPIVRGLAKGLRVPRPIGVLVTLLLGFLLLALFSWLITVSASQLADNREIYEYQLKKLLTDVEAMAREVAAKLKIRLDEGPSVLSGFVDTAAGAVSTVMNAALGVLQQTVLVLVFLAFLLLGDNTQSDGGTLWPELKNKMRSYLLAKIFLSIVIGVLVGMTLSMLGVDLALVFGMLAFLLNFVPNIGPVLATLLPLPIVLLNPELSTTAKVLAFVIPGAIQFVLGNVIETKVMGKSLDLHAVVVLVALLFWGVLWGMVGVLLAVPMTAVLKLLLERSEWSRPAANALAGRFGGSGDSGSAA